MRLWTLGDKSLLTDEASSYYFSQLSIRTLLWHLCDPHPPGYYLFLRGIAALGTSEWWLRLPSALAGALAVPLTWLVARQAIRPASPSAAWPGRAALLAAGLVAFAPLHVWYSQEARPYALMTALALATAWAGLRWWLRPSIGGAALFVLFGWLALFAEFGALLAWFGLNLFLLSGWPWQEGEQNQQVSKPADQNLSGGRLAERQDGRPDKGRERHGAGWRWIALQAVLLAPLVGWWLASAQAAVWAGPSYQAVFLAVQARGLGLEITPDQARRLIEVFLLAGAGAGLALALAARRSARVRGWVGSPLVAWLLLGLVLALGVAGVVPRLYTVKRHLTVLAPFVSIAAAWAWTRWQSASGRQAGWARLMTAGVLAALLTLSLVPVAVLPKAPWREAVAGLAAEVRAGDAIWVDEMDAPVFDYYWRGPAPWQALSTKDLAALETASPSQRVWLISTVTPYRDLHQTLPPGFSRGRTASRQINWPGIAAVAYDSRSQPQPEGQAAPKPAEELLWGMDLLSPLDTSCR